ncbi:MULTISPECIES: rhodanese-like domain-containing protein [Geobacillus]|jgi:rhodanese-related sulfurtransferase|uniref:Rhodanese-like domain-containing protein n=1 Tax=Geobacillus thermodenitrificans TaxID=33940 RepID=A0ABY9QB29_GEOTD|nr:MULTISPECIES: rhodanese-like domain-containing protein [Geobacillus]ARA98758.1 rhodanese-like domain-containing protein [Geobacillus thermodenitrificans]ARP43850.1 rhodanese-like domain-containing protein [Geobacillus thermodenitrificans]ATO38112.1 rhodanese-like domain-containing protein [Geobacillus thermodenitrificans]MEC5187027.1 rhodanese-related sulfurtransferase [Geobacillus thermodenitrificans]MED3718284.1 rhodanese-like domain-containing protein [Geobacillus thermodenitrificans]
MEEIKEITAAEVKEKLERGEKLNIVDVREDEEVALGMIPGAKHIKMGDIPNRLDELDKEEEYIFVCRSGRRSENVCRYLQELGYRVCNMIGGMLEWEGETVTKQ